VRAGYTFIRNNKFTQEPIKDADIGIGRSTANQYSGLPLIRIAPAAGGVIIGTAATIDGRAGPTVATFADTVSLNQGRHFLRIGSEIRVITKSTSMFRTPSAAKSISRTSIVS